METMSKQTSENFIKEVRRKTRRVFNSEQKIAIVMEALRAETSVAELCRKHSIFEAQFYKWNKEFLEAGKKRLAGDTVREATSDEVAELRKENQKLKEAVADLINLSLPSPFKYQSSGVLKRHYSNLRPSRTYLILLPFQMLRLHNVVLSENPFGMPTLPSFPLRLSVFSDKEHYAK